MLLLVHVHPKLFVLNPVNLVQVLCAVEVLDIETPVGKAMVKKPFTEITVVVTIVNV